MEWLPDSAYRTSPRARPSALTRFHTPDYVAAVMQAETDQAVTDATRKRHGLGTLSNPIFPEMFRRPATSVGGALLATDMIAQGGVAFHPGGGTHHGMADRANGFCYFNDPVLAIMALRRQGLTRIVYVDIDAHHCDGVEAAFAGSQGVRLISTHEAGRWPFTGALADTAGGVAFNLPLPRGLNDTEFALVRDTFIVPATAAFDPQAILLQCGADAVTEDPLSRLALSNNAHLQTVAALMPLAPRLLVLGGGGYNPWSVARLWTGVWATLNDREIPERLPEPARAILEAITWTRRAGRTPERHWQDTLRDAPRPGPVRAEIKTSVATLQRRI
jgi:acetoin utilization protein AcuC